jgi:hypothetical protein
MYKLLLVHTHRPITSKKERHEKDEKDAWVGVVSASVAHANDDGKDDARCDDDERDDDERDDDDDEEQRFRDFTASGDDDDEGDDEDDARTDEKA